MAHPHASWFPGLAAALSLAVVSASAAQQKTAPAPALQDVMQRAVVATASFEREFAAVVADEHLVQRIQAENRSFGGRCARIEPETGRVIKTLVKTVGTPDPGVPAYISAGVTLMWVETTFAPNSALGLWVPEKMTEWARAEDRTEVSGSATYSRFRRFTVKTVETFQDADNRTR